MNPILEKLTQPNVLEAAATLAALAPPPEGPMLAAALKLVAAWRQAGKTQDEIDALVKQYSAEAQVLAEGWNG